MRIGLLAALLCLPGSGSAWASGWITGSPRTERGPGVKVGKRSRFHPGFGLLVGYDSNVFRTRRAETITQAGFTTPALWAEIGNTPMRNGRLDSDPKLDGRNVDYNLTVGADYRIYLTGDERVRQAGKFNAQVDFHMVGRPGRKLSLLLDEEFRRRAEPQNFEAGADFNFNRLDHRGAVGLRARPGGGRLSLTFKFRNEFLYYESTRLDKGDRTVNGLFHETKWRFRDRMAFLAQYQFDYYYHFCCTDVGDGRNEDSEQHRVYGGFSGQLGERWVLQALGGWGWGLYKDDVNGPNHRNLLLESGLSFFPKPQTEIALEVHRRFEDSLWGNYFSEWGGSFSAEHTFRFGMHIFGGVNVGRRRTSGLPVPGVETQDITGYVDAGGFRRTDLLIGSQVRLEQALGKIFTVGLRYDLWVDRTNFQAIFADGNVDIGGYVRHMVSLMGAIRY